MNGEVSLWFTNMVEGNGDLKAEEVYAPGRGTNLPAGTMASSPYATLNVVLTSGWNPSGVWATVNRSKVAARARVEKCIIVRLKRNTKI